MLRPLLLACLIVIAGCADQSETPPDVRSPEAEAPVPAAGEAPVASADGVAAAGRCTAGSGAGIKSTSAAGVEIGAPEEEVRAMCDVVRDTILRMEGSEQPGFLVATPADTLLVEIVDASVSRITVLTAGLRTADSLGVGSPVARVAQFDDAIVAAGEGRRFLLSPSHCGLSFEIGDLPSGTAVPALDELRGMPDRFTVSQVLVTGGC